MHRNTQQQLNEKVEKKKNIFARNKADLKKRVLAPVKLPPNLGFGSTKDPLRSASKSINQISEKQVGAARRKKKKIPSGTDNIQSMAYDMAMKMFHAAEAIRVLEREEAALTGASGVSDSSGQNNSTKVYSLPEISAIRSESGNEEPTSSRRSPQTQKGLLELASTAGPAVVVTIDEEIRNQLRRQADAREERVSTINSNNGISDNIFSQNPMKGDNNKKNSLATRSALDLCTHLDDKESVQGAQKTLSSRMRAESGKENARAARGILTYGGFDGANSGDNGDSQRQWREDLAKQIAEKEARKAFEQNSTRFWWENERGTLNESSSMNPDCTEQTKSEERDELWDGTKDKICSSPEKEREEITRASKLGSLSHGGVTDRNVDEERHRRIAEHKAMVRLQYEKAQEERRAKAKEAEKAELRDKERVERELIILNERHRTEDERAEKERAAKLAQVKALNENLEMAREQAILERSKRIHHHVDVPEDNKAVLGTLSLVSQPSTGLVQAPAQPNARVSKIPRKCGTKGQKSSSLSSNLLPDLGTQNDENAPQTLPSQFSPVQQSPVSSLPRQYSPPIPTMRSKPRIEQVPLAPVSGRHSTQPRDLEHQIETASVSISSPTRDHSEREVIQYQQGLAQLAAIRQGLKRRQAGIWQEIEEGSQFLRESGQEFAANHLARKALVGVSRRGTLR